MCVFVAKHTKLELVKIPTSIHAIKSKVTTYYITLWTLCLIPVFQYRCETVVPQRMTGMERAIRERDFKSFARLTMQVNVTSPWQQAGILGNFMLQKVLIFLQNHANDVMCTQATHEYFTHLISQMTDLHIYIRYM